MSEDIRQQVRPDIDTNSADFKQGAAAGLDSAGDCKNYQVGNDRGQEPKDEGEQTKPAPEGLVDEASTPLFLEDNPEGNQGNQQDEKDGTEE